MCVDDGNYVSEGCEITLEFHKSNFGDRYAITCIGKVWVGWAWTRISIIIFSFAFKNVQSSSDWQFGHFVLKQEKETFAKKIYLNNLITSLNNIVYFFFAFFLSLSPLNSCLIEKKKTNKKVIIRRLEWVTIQYPVVQSLIKLILDYWKHLINLFIYR